MAAIDYKQDLDGYRYYLGIRKNDEPWKISNYSFMLNMNENCISGFTNLNNWCHYTIQHKYIKSNYTFAIIKVKGYFQDNELSRITRQMNKCYKIQKLKSLNYVVSAAYFSSDKMTELMSKIISDKNEIYANIIVVGDGISLELYVNKKIPVKNIIIKNAGFNKFM